MRAWTLLILGLAVLPFVGAAPHSGRTASAPYVGSWLPATGGLGDAFPDCSSGWNVGGACFEFAINEIGAAIRVNDDFADRVCFAAMLSNATGSRVTKFCGRGTVPLDVPNAGPLVVKVLSSPFPSQLPVRGSITVTFEDDGIGA